MNSLAYKLTKIAAGKPAKTLKQLFYSIILYKRSYPESLSELF